MIYMFLSNNPSSGDINSSNLPCWPLHTRFCDLVRWTVVIGAMLKTGFGKKVHIPGFVNEPTIYYINLCPAELMDMAHSLLFSSLLSCMITSDD